MTKKKLRFGALPKRQMPRKSHQSSQPTPRHERSVVKDVVEIPASTSFYSTFQEFSQRAKNLKTIGDWMSKFSVDKAVFKKMTEPYMLPQLEIIVDDGLGFTVMVGMVWLLFSGGPPSISGVPSIDAKCYNVKFSQRTRGL